MAVGGFGAIVLLLLLYVYWSTTSFLLGHADRAIAREDAFLQTAYAQGGRPALEAAVKARIADSALSDKAYLLTDPDLKPIVGDLGRWPDGLSSAPGWTTFRRASATNPKRYRASVQKLADESRLLVATDVSDLDSFTRKIDAALAFT